MPLPMMALLRLNTDIPNDVFPSNYRHQSRMETRGESAQGGCIVVLSQSTTTSPEHLINASSFPTVPPLPQVAQLTSVKCGSLLGLF